MLGIYLDGGGFVSQLPLSLRFPVLNRLLGTFFFFFLGLVCCTPCHRRWPPPKFWQKVGLKATDRLLCSTKAVVCVARATEDAPFYLETQCCARAPDYSPGSRRLQQMIHRFEDCLPKACSDAKAKAGLDITSHESPLICISDRDTLSWTPRPGMGSRPRWKTVPARCGRPLGP